MTNSTRPNAAALCAEVAQRWRRIPEPRSYWNGRPERPPVLPQNLLLFRRSRNTQFSRPSRPHQHHRFLFIGNLEGRGAVGVDQALHRLDEGHGLLVFPFQSHYFTDLTPRLHWIFVTFEYARGTSLETLRGEGPRPITAESFAHLQNLAEAWREPARESSLPLHLALLLDALQRQTKTAPRPKRAAAAVSDFNDLVVKVNRYIFDHRQEPITLAQLARRLGFSISSLRSRFRAATGRSLGRHIREIKLNHACELLHGTRLTIEEIARNCGYDSLFSFSRAFRTAHGRPPTRYRAAFASAE